MNIWLGMITLIFVFATGVIICIKHKNIRSVLWNIVLFITSGVALWVGSGSTQLWVILLCSMIIGGGLLIAAVHGYNKILTSGKVNESVGENRKPRPFGNGYWR